MGDVQPVSPRSLTIYGASLLKPQIAVLGPRRLRPLIPGWGVPTHCTGAASATRARGRAAWGQPTATVKLLTALPTASPCPDDRWRPTPHQPGLRAATACSTPAWTRISRLVLAWPGHGNSLKPPTLAPPGWENQAQAAQDILTGRERYAPAQCVPRLPQYPPTSCPAGGGCSWCSRCSALSPTSPEARRWAVWDSLHFPATTSSPLPKRQRPHLNPTWPGSRRGRRTMPTTPMRQSRLPALA